MIGLLVVVAVDGGGSELGVFVSIPPSLLVYWLLIYHILLVLNMGYDWLLLTH